MDQWSVIHAPVTDRTIHPNAYFYNNELGQITLEWIIEGKTVKIVFENSEVDKIAHTLSTFNLCDFDMGVKNIKYPWTQEQFLTICKAALIAFKEH